jgi:hypothetical protein
VLDERFTNTKWLRLRDALALACRRLARNNAKQEICDLVISKRLIMRGEKSGQYIFFDSQYYRSYVMPSNINWRGGSLYQFHESHNSPNNLRILNDMVFQNFVAGRSLTNAKPADSADAEPQRPSGSRGGRPDKFPWDDVWIETCRYVHHKGVPANPAELMKYLQQWCEIQFGQQPADSTLKPKLRKLYTALLQPD